MICEYCATKFVPRQRFCSSKCRTYSFRGDNLKIIRGKPKDIKKPIKDEKLTPEYKKEHPHSTCPKCNMFNKACVC